MPYNEKTEQVILDDFKRLWATNFLDDLCIDVDDDPSQRRGRQAVIYNMEERQRVKIVDYAGSKKVERKDRREDEGGEHRAAPRLVPRPGLIRRVEGIVRDLMAEKGYQFAEVNRVEALPGGPKLVQGGFRRQEGPQGQGPRIDFNGNTAVSDGALTSR